MHFDAIYTGYLGSFRQIDIILEVIDRLKGERTMVMVDPVMADGGVLYPGFPADFPEGMRRLVAKADVIMPNMTEAALLLGEDYKEGPYKKEYIEGILGKLAELGPKTVVLTGVFFDEESLGAASFEGGKVNFAMQKRTPGAFHGTGDVFGSALVGAMVRGVRLDKALEIATRFVVGSIERTLAEGTDIRFGVNFEEGLGEFGRAIELISALAEGEASVQSESDWVLVTDAKEKIGVK